MESGLTAKDEMVLMTQVILREGEGVRQVILKEEESARRYFDMSVGPLEFMALAKEQGKVRPPRPLTHDLYLALLEGLDVLVLDALRWRPHPTHFSVDQALEVVDRVKPSRTYFTHICHDLDHEETNLRLPEGVELAYDGLAVDLVSSDGSDGTNRMPRIGSIDKMETAAGGEGGQ